MLVNDECVFSFPFHILELIMKFCGDVDYLNFRATCKHLAAVPVIRWSNITEIQRTYSLVSPWSMVIDTDRDIMTITDLMSGNKYFIRTSQELVGFLQVHCSRYGWLLTSKNTSELMFFNPFTSDIRKLPRRNYPLIIDKCCFSAAPTSPDCMVVVITTLGDMQVYIHHVSREQSWRRLAFTDFYSVSLCFPTFYGQDMYALMRGRLYVFRHTKEDDYEWQSVEWDLPYIKPSMKYYLTKSDQHVLLVSVDVFEKSVEVHKLNQSTSKLEKLKSLGKYAIYVSATTCLCIEATTPKMENKVYFHQSYSENNTILFYSLETRRFHTFDDDNLKGSFGDFFKDKRLLLPHGWIEPSVA
ncbi:F-box/kelch-repeat protein At1g57790-like [Rutidosis leptorrhynchoides]|uniref:F-box/kelch-repeat protein At1g57790-like n=1 Tax=Rutidosis leptorrhynchoides TaxID=125765 RepID=UPI003A9A2A8C